MSLDPATMSLDPVTISVETMWGLLQLFFCVFCAHLVARLKPKVLFFEVCMTRFIGNRNLFFLEAEMADNIL